MTKFRLPFSHSAFRKIHASHLGGNSADWIGPESSGGERNPPERRCGIPMFSHCDFNPLRYQMLREQPRKLSVHSAWNEHVPFAMMLVEIQRPRQIVELGTHWGVSYCAFCQAVATTKIKSRCRAVDTWRGDLNAGLYGDGIYEDLAAHHRQYEHFSRRFWILTIPMAGFAGMIFPVGSSRLTRTS